MKLLIIVLVSIMTLPTMAFQINTGRYISDNCGEVVVEQFTGHPDYNDGDYVIRYSSLAFDTIENTFEPYMLGYSIYNPSFDKIYNISGLCMDEEIDLTPKIKMSTAKKLDVSCGGPLSAINDKLQLTVNDNNDLQSISFVSKVAKVSLSSFLFIPGLQKEKIRLECSAFIKM